MNISKYNSLAREALLSEVLPENHGACYVKLPNSGVYRSNYIHRANGLTEDFLVPGFVIQAAGLLSRYGAPLCGPQYIWKYTVN